MFLEAYDEAAGSMLALRCLRGHIHNLPGLFTDGCLPTAVHRKPGHLSEVLAPIFLGSPDYFFPTLAEQDHLQTVGHIQSFSKPHHLAEEQLDGLVWKAQHCAGQSEPRLKPAELAVKPGTLLALSE